MLHVGYVFVSTFKHLIYICSFRRILNRTLVPRSLKVLRDMVSLKL